MKIRAQREIAWTLASLGAAVVGGCTQFNERPVIGQSTTINPISQTGPAPELDKTDDAPSIASLDRSSWKKQTFLVPVDGAGHQPTGRHDTNEVRFTNRQLGKFPTAESSLDLDGKPEHKILGEEITESAGAPLVGVIDVICMPFRLIFDPPTRLVRSPSWDYQRWPSPAQHAQGVELPDPAAGAPTEPLKADPADVSKEFKPSKDDL